MGPHLPQLKTSAKYLITRKFLATKRSVSFQNVTASHPFKISCLLGNSKFYYRSKGMREAVLSNWIVLRIPSV